MAHYSGKSIFNSIAHGKIFYYEKTHITVPPGEVEDVENEIKRFQDAKEKAIEQVKDLYEKAKREFGESEAAIFKMHAMMLDDENYCNSIETIISSQKANAAYAVSTTCESFSQVFEEMDDEYMKARSIDIKDISQRIVRILHKADVEVAKGTSLNTPCCSLVHATSQVQSSKGVSQCPRHRHTLKLTQLTESVIIVADDLTPSETIQMDKSRILGFVTKYGSPHSHTAILARTMGIPALIGVDIQKDWHGKYAILDGYKGTIVIDPDEAQLHFATETQKQDLQKKELFETLKGEKTITKNGLSIKIFANIGSVTDTDAVLRYDGGGIGLFRSEFLYLDATDFPTEEEQFRAYKAIAEKMTGKKVVIRTLDLGADKQVDYIPLEKEENPALGYRAIRICLKEPHLFKTQLRAILRAASFGNVSIMFPMIISVSELLRAKEILQEVKFELQKQGIPFGEAAIGIMIETPAAVMIADELAKEVDFFSIGTNDLTQYTLAIDRKNPRLNDFYDAHHPAVLKMIQMTVESAHKAGVWVGICGELAADLSLTETFLRMGIDELSVSPPFILPLREKVRNLDLS